MAENSGTESIKGVPPSLSSEFDDRQTTVFVRVGQAKISEASLRQIAQMLANIPVSDYEDEEIILARLFLPSEADGNMMVPLEFGVCFDKGF